MFKYNNQYVYVCTDYLEADNQSTTPTEPEKPITGKDSAGIMLTGYYLSFLRAGKDKKI